jgi:hypothetical protein
VSKSRAGRHRTQVGRNGTYPAGDPSLLGGDLGLGP